LIEQPHLDGPDYVCEVRAQPGLHNVLGCV
jgi:hypothetical protein